MMFGVSAQIIELQIKHDEAMAAISTLNQISYVYERWAEHTILWWYQEGWYCRSVNEFMEEIEEIERVLRAWHQFDQEQYDFVISLLRGTALKEI